ncbi:hypothetical protein R6Q59_026462 [Mikania micrantha]
MSELASKDVLRRRFILSRKRVLMFIQAPCKMGLDIPYGFEVLIENLMDPSHVPYAHHGIMMPPGPQHQR